MQRARQQPHYYNRKQFIVVAASPVSGYGIECSDTNEVICLWECYPNLRGDKAKAAVCHCFQFQKLVTFKYYAIIMT